MFLCLSPSRPTLRLCAPPMLTTPELIAAGAEDANAATIAYLMCRFPELGVVPASEDTADGLTQVGW
jgi:hypothetical protein